MSSLVRGDTYYVADGSYAARTWNRAVSGASLIIIKKATAGDHGTDAGWSTTFGDGQATFVGANTVTTGFWEFDGVAGDHASGVPYGFRFDFSEGQTAMLINTSSSTVTMRYIDFDGITTTGNYVYRSGTKGLEVWSGNNWTVSHCSFHGGESLIQAGGNGVLVEYSYFYNARSTAPAYHGNVYFNSGSSNGTFRFNRAWDYNDEGLFFTGWSGGPTDWKVYGNVFSGTGSEVYPRGIEIRQGYNYRNIEIYNNTFVNLNVGGILNRASETGNSCTGCVARNNLSYNAGNTLTGMTATSNTADSTNRFVNLGARDFRLTAPLAGESLGVAFDRDLAGYVRGSDGTWDRGAHEFGGSGSAPEPPRNLTSIVR